MKPEGTFVYRQVWNGFEFKAAAEALRLWNGDQQEDGDIAGKAE